jgi:hypothetical protein
MIDSIVAYEPAPGRQGGWPPDNLVHRMGHRTAVVVGLMQTLCGSTYRGWLRTSREPVLEHHGDAVAGINFVKLPAPV